MPAFIIRYGKSKAFPCDKAPDILYNEEITKWSYENGALFSFFFFFSFFFWLFQGLTHSTWKHMEAG